MDEWTDHYCYYYDFGWQAVVLAHGGVGVVGLCLSVALPHACRCQGSPATLALHRRAHRGAFS